MFALGLRQFRNTGSVIGNFSVSLKPSTARATRAPAFTTSAFPRNGLVTNTVTTTTGPPQQIQQQQLEEGQEIDDGPRIPLSIQANYYAPLRREPTHGLPVCNLQLRSFSVPNLELMCDFALRAAYYAHLPASGPIPLPKRIERWTVPRSNFVNKKSQENFERITYKRLIQIKDGNIETVEMWLAFLKMHQYHGVGLKANIWTWDEVGVGKNMNISLETLRDVPRPKWAHFGPRKNVSTAEKAREILNTSEYKDLQPQGISTSTPPSASEQEQEEKHSIPNL